MQPVVISFVFLQFVFDTLSCLVCVNPYRNAVEMESTMENITEMENERVEKDTNQETETVEPSHDNVTETDKVIETEEQIHDDVTETDKVIESEEQSHDNVMETEDMNPGETVGEENPVRDHKDSPSHASTLEQGANDDDLPKLDDEKSSLIETSPHLSRSPEEGLVKPAVEDTVDSVKADKDAAVVHGEATTIPDTEVSEDKRSPLCDDTTVEQDKSAEEHDMISSGVCNEIPVIPDTKPSEEEGSPRCDDTTVMEQDKAAEEYEVIPSRDHNPDTKLSEDKGSPLHQANNTVMEQDEVAEEHEMITSGDQIEFAANPDAKDVEENDDRIDKSEADDMILADHGSGPVDHDQSATTELDKGPELPSSETVSELENNTSEPLVETSMDVEKEPDMPATENLTENDQNSDVLDAGVSGDSDKGLTLLPATQTSSDHNEGVTTVEAEPTADMELDVPDSKLVTDASVDSTNNKDMNVEAPTNAIGLVRSDTDIESASVRLEPGPLCVASSDTTSEVGVSGGLNNGVHKTNLAPPGFDGTMSANRVPPGFDGTMSTKRSFLLDDTSDGNESGTEEDQSDFMKELDHFFKERSMDFKPPKFYGEGLNCLKLWRAVTRLGGYDKVTGCKLWRQVGESFRPPKTCTTVSWTFRGFYEKALLEYERHKVIGGELHIPLAHEQEPMNIDNQATGSGRARRDAASRAMQGWHSQRLNGNGEVTDPAAIKDKNLVIHQKREKQIGTSPGMLKRKRPSTEHGAKNVIQVSKPMLDVTVVDVGPPADWVKINVQRTQDCFEVYALVPGLVREEVRVQSDPAGRLVISGEPENPMNPWGATPFKKVVSLPTRIDPHHTSAVVTLNGQLFVRVPLEQSD
ncbi:unnamed protein product [Thlaspi arvense]|uniref:AT-rich interactive domain-containing protein 3 n=1 Tax=Thlaspi arvense TaxID=13288 RepID=A0AAU9RVV4_THLAR|nr:unnamed protein product [Thlaspi arvense]